MSSSKKWSFKNIFRANGVCGCGRTKPEDIFEPKPKPETPLENLKSVDEDEEDGTSTTFSLDNETLVNGPKCSKMLSPCPKICDSLAIVKDSEDPYQDFHQSMLQMILEREIYSRDDLQELLNCFLELNSPHHHQIIVKAFVEIWNLKTRAADGGSSTEEIKTSPIVLPEESQSRDT